mgnify:CR=1 FL=1
MKTTKNRGFSLIELIIVIALIGVISSIAVLSWQRYVNNINLKTAARDIVSEMQNCKTKAFSESRTYDILFTPGTNSSYTISAPAAANFAAVNKTKLLEGYGSGIQMTGVSFVSSPASNIIRFQARGTCSQGTVTLTNSRNSTATVTTEITGKAYVTLNMQ